MSYKGEVIAGEASMLPMAADESEKWTANALCFATPDEAETYVKDLQRRWILVTRIRVVHCDDPVNARLVNRRLEMVAEDNQ